MQFSAGQHTRRPYLSSSPDRSAPGPEWSIGARFMPTYQVTVDPLMLGIYGIALSKVSRVNRDVGGRVVEMADTE